MKMKERWNDFLRILFLIYVEKIQRKDGRKWRKIEDRRLRNPFSRWFFSSRFQLGLPRSRDRRYIFNRPDDLSTVLSNLTMQKRGEKSRRSKQLTFVPGEPPELLEERHCSSWLLRSRARSRPMAVSRVQCQREDQRLRSPITITIAKEKPPSCVNVRARNAAASWFTSGHDQAVCEALLCLPLTRDPLTSPALRSFLAGHSYAFPLIPTILLLQGEPEHKPRQCRVLAAPRSTCRLILRIWPKSIFQRKSSWLTF